MDTKFYFFLRSSIDGERKLDPVCTYNEFLGAIGDYVEIDGAGYIIDDYASELISNEWEDCDETY